MERGRKNMSDFLRRFAHAASQSLNNEMEISRLDERPKSRSRSLGIEHHQRMLEVVREEERRPHSARRESGNLNVRRKNTILVAEPLARKLGLSFCMQRALVTSWQRLNMDKRAGGTGATVLIHKVFERLSSRCPSVSNVFVTNASYLCLGGVQQSCPNLQQHEGLVLQVLSDTIDSLDQDYEAPTKALMDMGEKHNHLIQSNFEKGLWEKFGEAFVDVSTTMEMVRKVPDAPKAWMIFIAAVIDCLNAGFEKRQRRPSFTEVPTMSHFDSV